MLHEGEEKQGEDHDGRCVVADSCMNGRSASSHS